MAACVHLVRCGIQCPCDQRVDSTRQWDRTGASGIRAARLRVGGSNLCHSELVLEVVLDDER